MFRHFPDLRKKRVGILAGRGNNGGMPLQWPVTYEPWGCRARFIFSAAREEVKGNAAANLEILTRMGGTIFEVLNLEEWEARKGRLPIKTFWSTASWEPG